MNENKLENTFKTVNESDGEILDSCFSFVKSAVEAGQKPDDKELLRVFEKDLNLPEDYPDEKRERIMNGDIFTSWRDSIIKSAESYIKYQEGKITQEKMNKIDNEREKLRLQLNQEFF